MDVLIGEMKELYVVVFSSRILCHVEKQKHMNIEKSLYWKGQGEGAVGCFHYVVLKLFISPLLEGSL